jgi:hypothetical protein
MAALAGQMPLLLLWQPSRTEYSPSDWGVLRGYLASRNVSLPAIEVPAGLLAILRPATGECRVYVAKKPDQWAYLSVLAEVFP